MLADIFYLDMITPENPHGSMKANETYKCLLDMRVWGFNNNDPGLAWNRRRWAQEAAQVISKSTTSLVEAVAAEKEPKGLLEALISSGKRTGSLKEGSLRSYGHRLVEKLLAAGKTIEQTSDICWLTAYGGVAAPVTAVCIPQSKFLYSLIILLSSSSKFSTTSSPKIIEVAGKKSKPSQQPTLPPQTKFSSNTSSKPSV